jgi:hypothetical protein
MHSSGSRRRARIRELSVCVDRATKRFLTVFDQERAGFANLFVPAWSIPKGPERLAKTATKVRTML